jgi:hypothetical protein
MNTAHWLAWCLLGQLIPAGPVELAHGTVTVGGEATITASSRDNIAFFNFTDYEHNALRMFRISLAGMWRPSTRVSFVTELRSENAERMIPYALYARVRPWKTRPFDIQAGRIPPVFGAFGRRSYGADNPLIGYPLAYQYLTSLRPDAIPATADDLLFMRARGWRATYPIGDLTPAPGVPLVSAYRWDTGIEAHAEGRGLDVAGAVTTGTLSNPRVGDDNGGRQLSGRIGVKPAVGLVLGVSGARGAFLRRALADLYSPLSGGGDFTQTAIGFDAEYSRDYWIVRGEAIRSRWTLPSIAAPRIDGPLSADAAFVETRYRFTPRLYAAGRVDRLTFSKIEGARFFDGVPTSWDAPVTRLEIGGGISLQRNLTLRAVVQRDWRDGGRERKKTYVSGQLSYWF